MNYNNLTNIARKYIPDATDEEVGEFVKIHPNINEQEFERAIQQAAPDIGDRFKPVEDREAKMSALKYMRG